MASRRRFLAVLGATTTAVAGCATRADVPPEPGSTQSTDPDEHVYGADGEWSSFGCNASNTRTVADGKAPVDGVSEKWRVEVPQTTYQEPLVTDGRVFVTTPSSFVVYDAADGTELWRKDDENGADVGATPLVRDGTVYAGLSDRLFALDAETGETKWERTFGATGSVRTPSVNRGWLYVPVGETVVRVDSRTGDSDWSRQLFGTVLGSPPVYSGFSVAFVTEAGKLYLLDDDGTGHGEWNLPSRPQAPPTADTDGIYVNCLDEKTYGISLENPPLLNVDWETETGWASGGLAVKHHLYAAGTRGIRAINPESGERAWKRDTGDWRWTGPALGRDTLFVGGDKLYAFDPTPESGLFEDGPALRFEKSFYGRVGPGPVLDDGSLYVVARTGKRNYHLLALD